MNAVIDALFDAYDQGEVGRPEVVATILAQQFQTDMPSLPSQPGVLVGINLNHINIGVADIERSETFYRTLFSLPPKRAVPGRPDTLDLGDGVSFLSIPERSMAGVIDHYCVGVKDFDATTVAAKLTAAGFTDGLTVGPDFVYITDPDGVRVQLSDPVWRG